MNLPGEKYTFPPNETFAKEKKNESTKVSGTDALHMWRFRVANRDTDSYNRKRGTRKLLTVKPRAEEFMYTTTFTA